ncbi:MAG: DUF4386 domain-containing protein [Candidatus Bathyarchaeota archaeon]|nr:MAG: DUF4386 domain-containing protein [Candidatus Bathyarchaeota archaeon]
MDSNRKTAIIVGVLFIVATAAPILSVVPLGVVPLGFLGSEGDPDYLTAVSANENQVLIGALLWLAMTASVVAIPILMFPILKKHGESLALGYVGARMFEGFFDAVNVISLLLLLSLGREFVDAGAPAASYFQTSGALLLAVIDWGSLLLDLAWLLSVPVFSYLLYKSTLIPRWLSGWGLVGGTLWLATWPVRMFGLSPPSIEILALPIAAQEMILAGWLIVKGFNSSAIAS